ncbi:hypothetical protein [Synechococcus sp. UW140]|uniref:hypothetical protein n=1 Tax=Synechococcus sp. UW140 TaxID=368503 RepID=UPI0025D261B2|nr:hypothetical protein [Synechococcus sp. UW140]
MNISPQIKSDFFSLMWHRKKQNKLISIKKSERRSEHIIARIRWHPIESLNTILLDAFSAMGVKTPCLVNCQPWPLLVRMPIQAQVHPQAGPTGPPSANINIDPKI